MAEYAERRRIIIDAHPGDFAKCLELANEGLRSGHVGSIWGYWSQGDPDFQASVRINPGSVSVRGVRLLPTPEAGESV